MISRPLNLGLAFCVMSVITASAQPPGHVNRRLPKGKPLVLWDKKPVDKAGYMMEFAPEIDRLKAKVDEWGTLSFSPIVFALPEVGTKAPFELREEVPLTLEGLYADYNVSNGQILYAERKRLKAQAAYGYNADVASQEIEGAKMRNFEINQQRVIDGQIARQELAERQFVAAQERQEQAREGVKKSGAAFAEAQRLHATATAALAAAKAKVAVQEAREDDDAAAAELTQAKLDLIDAQRDYDLAVASLASAEKANTAATSELSAANSAAATAETEYVTKANEQVAFPSTAPTPTVPGNPLGSIDLEGNGGKVGGSDGLGTIGDDALPSVLPPKDSAAAGGSFPVMARINSAASALTVKNIHSFLGKPEAALQFEDKRILFGVSSLSVNPGWRTKRDFKALVSARMSFDFTTAHPEVVREILRSDQYPLSLRRRIARENPGVLTGAQRAFYQQDQKGLPVMGGTECRTYFSDLEERRAADSNALKDSVVISAVSPMVDSQNLDLASSIARQNEFALYLAGALTNLGSSQAGKFFSSWESMRRKDVATKSSVATANSTTMGGGAFAFEIGTKLSGLDDKDAKKEKSAWTLDRQTFPVLLMIGMKDEDVKPRLSLNGGKICIEELEISVLYSVHWSRVNKSFWTNTRNDRVPSDSYADIIRIFGKAGQMKAGIDSLCDGNGTVASSKDGMAGCEVPPPPPTEFYKQGVELAQGSMNQDWHLMLDQLFGSEFRLTLPAGWIFDMKGNDDLLSDNETIVTEGDVGFGLPRYEPFRFDRLKEPQTLVLQGKKLGLLDPATVQVLGEGVELVGQGGTAVGSNAIAVKLQALQGSGEFRITAGHRHRTDRVVSHTLEYRVGEGLLPAIEPFGDKVYDIVGSREAVPPVATAPDKAPPVVVVPPTAPPGVPPPADSATSVQQGTPAAPPYTTTNSSAKGPRWRGVLELPLQGTGLDRLERREVKVSGTGLEGSIGEIIGVASDSMALVSVELNTLQSSGEAFLIFDAPVAGGRTPYQAVKSPVFKYRFVDSTPPSLKPWRSPVFSGKGKVVTTAKTEETGNQKKVSDSTESKKKEKGADVTTTKATEVTGAEKTSPKVNKSWSGSFEVILHGRQLGKLDKEKATIEGFTGKVEFLWVGDETAILNITASGLEYVDDNTPPKGGGYLVLPVEGEPDGVALFSAPFKFQLFE